jgi:hypothetical protein
MSKIVSFRIGKGKTSRPSEEVEEWVRKYLELEIKLPEQFTEEGFQEALLKAEYLIDNFLGAPEVEAAKIPTIDIAEINSLIWMSYKTKQPCTKPDEPGWTFSDPARHEPNKQKIVQQLAETIAKAKNKLQLGTMIYTFSGPKEDPKLFISRRPLTEKARASTTHQ